MGTSDNASLIRPLVLGIIVGLILGLSFGLYYAWALNPAVYAGGALPTELNEEYQKEYTKAAVEAYFQTRQLVDVKNRLREFGTADQVKLLASVSNDFVNGNDSVKQQEIISLASQLKAQDNWADNAISTGLKAGNANAQFAEALGQTGVTQPPPVDTTPGEATPEPTSGTTVPQEEGTSWGRIFATGFLILLAIAVVVFLMTRIKTARKATTIVHAIPDEMILDDGSGLEPLRQWVGTYTFGQDNYDESFTVETTESDFLGECGMGILEGFASGSPKRTLAFDVWLFDKTDIRTLSRPVMSKFAFEDEQIRAKLPPDSSPVLAAEGSTFDIETTALTVKAKIEELEYGEGPPDMSFFKTLKISLSAYLKPGVDVSGSMPIPEGFN